MATINGGAGRDTLNGTDLADQIFGLGGDDTLIGFAGDDVLEGGGGADELFGSVGFDTVSYRSSPTGVAVELQSGSDCRGGHAQGDRLYAIDAVIGSNYGDVLDGSDQRNALRGEGGADLLFGYEGDDRLDGGGGNDELDGGAGADELRGGAGFDEVYYGLSVAAVRVDLAAGRGFGGDAEGDRLSGIEDVWGSQRGDHLTGDAAGNWLFGLDGDDVILGGGGNDVIAGGPGSDQLEGGSGIDTVDYSQAAFNVAIDLVAGQDADGPYGSISGFERAIGTAFSDRLYGDGGANGLVGGAGDDFLEGRLGRDELTGGTGADRFRFSFTTESGKTAATRDVLHDFRRAEGDHLDLSQLDASTGTAGDQDPTFIGRNAFTAEGQVRFLFEDDRTVVEVNTSGNSGADMQIELDGRVQLAASDFFFID